MSTSCRIVHSSLHGHTGISIGDLHLAASKLDVLPGSSGGLSLVVLCSLDSPPRASERGPGLMRNGSGQVTESFSTGGMGVDLCGVLCSLTLIITGSGSGNAFFCTKSGEAVESFSIGDSGIDTGGFGKSGSSRRAMSEL